jgi:acetyl-CoA C-acetyltransferase
MPVSNRLPCIVGVAQKTWRAEAGNAPHPLVQNMEVARAAVADCGNPEILRCIDEVDVVRSLSWHYDDLPGELATALGVPPGERKLSGMSGTGPQRFLCDAAETILQGQRRAVLVSGGEALATVKRAMKTGAPLDWPQARSKPEYPFEDPAHPSERRHDIRQAYTTFAILDSARRAHLGLSPDDNRRQEAAMMAQLSAQAAANPLAWFRKAHSAASLFDLSDNDRMVATPFSKNTMAFMDVDMAAALLITSHELADELNIPAAQRIYLHGWGYDKSPPYIAQRAELFHSPAMRAASEQALAMAGVTAAELDFLDLYSCFASNVNFTRDVLGIAEDDPRALTVTGGLPYFGGPGNNYTTHAIATMVELLRKHRGSTGLVTAVGMHMTNHSFAVYSSEPREINAIPMSRPGVDGRQIANLETESRDIVDSASGPAVIVGYTVLHGKADPHALAICELEGGARCYARCHDAEIVSAMQQQEWVGREIRLRCDNGVNTLFR